LYERLKFFFVTLSHKGPNILDDCQQKVRSSFLLRGAGAGRLRQGLEDLASIICEYLEQIIRKVY